MSRIQTFLDMGAGPAWAQDALTRVNKQKGRRLSSRPRAGLGARHASCRRRSAGLLGSCRPGRPPAPATIHRATASAPEPLVATGLVADGAGGSRRGLALTAPRRLASRLRRCIVAAAIGLTTAVSLPLPESSEFSAPRRACRRLPAADRSRHGSAAAWSIAAVLVSAIALAAIAGCCPGRRCPDRRWPAGCRTGRRSRRGHRRCRRNCRRAFCDSGWQLRLRGRNDAVVVLGMLQVVFGHNTVAGALSVAGKLGVFFRNLLRRSRIFTSGPLLS